MMARLWARVRAVWHRLWVNPERSRVGQADWLYGPGDSDDA